MKKPKQITVFDDPVIPVRVKLAGLWASTMFCYIYNDFFSLFRPGALKVMMSGRTALGPTTQEGLLASAMSIAMASAMIFLSLALPVRAARWLNIAFGAFCTMLVAALAFWPGLWRFYIALSAVEVVLTALIVWFA